MKTRKRGYGLLLGVTILLTLAAVSTLVPSDGASKACLLGYKAHCAFAPISTVICVVLAAVNCTIRQRLFTEIV